MGNFFNFIKQHQILSSFTTLATFLGVLWVGFGLGDYFAKQDLNRQKQELEELQAVCKHNDQVKTDSIRALLKAVDSLSYNNAALRGALRDTVVTVSSPYNTDGSSLIDMFFQGK